MSKTEQFTFGNMTALQTKYAINYINDTDMESNDIAKRISGYKKAPKVKTTTISHLRTYLSKFER